jgi:predicted ribosome quality control (RQC) complex YloA/Tae2 family protein
VALSAAEIAEVLEEIAPAVTAGWIQKISQPGPRTVVLEIRAPGRTLALLLSVDHETARIHLLRQKVPNPQVPPSFCQYLRAHIQGASVESVEQVAGDRIVRIRLTAREGPCSLLAELTGRRANLLVLDAGDHVLAALDQEHAKIGQPYAAPPRRTASAGAGIGEGLTAPSPAIAPGLPFPRSAAIEARYQEREEELTRARLRQARLTQVRKSLKRATRRVAALRGDLEQAGRYKEYARYGELLKSNLGRLRKGEERATLVDYFDPTLPELVIPLDPAKSPQGNMDDYFRKHRKHLAAERVIRPRLETAEQEAAALRKELAALQAGTWEPQTPPSPTSSPLRLRERARVRGDAKRAGPYRRFTSADGLPIYVGRNARENEELTFKFAHSDDLWLHARGAPGSHVVVRLEKGADPPPDTLRDAATLALLYSDLKKSGKGEVIYTRRKWVKKMKGQPAGTVAVTQDKTIFVGLDRIRLEAIKQRSGQAGAE